MLTVRAADQLEGRAVLPAATFAQGPTSGQQLGTNPINGQPVPFLNKQPVQGFSAVQDNGDGTFNVMPDNGFGALENSADFHLRVYHIRPDFKTKDGGSGAIAVLGFFELRDPDKRIPFTRGVSIGDFILTDQHHGLVIERDNTQGDLNGFKAVYKITLGAPGTFVNKELAVDLLRISDPHRISEPGQAGDVGIGRNFAFPFQTIEDILFFDRKHIGVLNDNNFPFSVGRHVGSGQPDDEEFIIIKLDRPL